MKKTLLSVASAVVFSGVAFSAQAADFTVPEPEIIVPFKGQADLLYNFIEVTWGYYGLEDNAGNDPIEATLTFPDGTEKPVRGIIMDANAEGEATQDVPTYVENALAFRYFMELNDDLQPIQQYGTYTLDIPAGVVLVNGVENPEATLTVIITGVQEQPKMAFGEMTWPTSPYTSFVYNVQVSWNQQIFFAGEDVNQAEIEAMIDFTTPLGAYANIVEVEGGNEDGTDMFTDWVLNIQFDNDFITYMDGELLEIYLPEGLVVNAEGEVNPAQTVEIYLLPQLTGTLNIEDGSSIAPADAYITVSWDGISVMPNNGTSLRVRNFATGADSMVEAIFNDDASISIDLTDFADGTYEISIPDAFVTILVEEDFLSDQYAINSEMYPSYTISSSLAVDAIQKSVEFGPVYNINGVRVLENSSNVKALHPGIYIINGKKVVVK